MFWGFKTACRLAICPTTNSPSLLKPTTEGVVRIPSELAITTGFPPSITATTELVVPRSMPTTLPMCVCFSSYSI
ncbi:Phosphoglycerol transferase I [Crocosphaera watsonii WH 0402]|uniref:Phosphoglycerol transferase I n=1 Tax=Crocosphaera watsonii WH 0402 TaxID=1284629 RepID=T2JUU7_CROWT|nr:Phosphoglycerol transferase I [Crocosphaera watsonii WH 0402]